MEKAVEFHECPKELRFITSGTRSGNYCRNIFGETVPTEPGRVTEHRGVMSGDSRIERPHFTQFPIVDLHHFSDAGELVGKENLTSEPAILHVFAELDRSSIGLAVGPIRPEDAGQPGNQRACVLRPATEEDERPATHGVLPGHHVCPFTGVFRPEHHRPFEALAERFGRAWRHRGADDDARRVQPVGNLGDHVEVR